MKTEGLNVGDNEQQAKKKCLRDTETVTVNPAGDKKFYEQGGFKGYPQLYSQNQTHGGKKNPLRTFSLPISLQARRH